MNMNIRHAQAWILPVLITLASFNGLIKAISGVRYAPLLIDATLVGLLLANFYTRILHDRLKIGVLDMAAGLFLIIAILEIFNPNIPSFQAGLEGFRKFSFMIIGFFIGRYVVNMASLKRLIGALLIGSFFISLYGIKQFILPTALDYRLIELSTSSPITFLMGGHIRAFSTLAGPFHLGIYTVCILLLLFAIWQHHPKRRLLVTFLAIPMLTALIMTTTKANWAGLLAGVLTIVLINSKHPLRLFGTLLLVMVFMWVARVFLLWFSSTVSGLETVYAGLQTMLNPLNILDAPTLKFRFDLWNDTVIPLMRQSPWFGYGTGSAGEGLLNLFENTSSTYIVAHNLYFKIQIELGLLGSLCFWGFLFYTLFDIWLVRRRLQDPLLKIVSHWTLAFAVAIMVAGLTGAILDAYPVNLIFWLLLGISTRLPRYSASEDFYIRLPVGNSALAKSEG